MQEICTKFNILGMWRIHKKRMEIITSVMVCIAMIIS